MSDLFSFSFEAKEEDITAWEKIFTEYASNGVGAKLYYAFDAFGQKVSDRLESLVEDEGWTGGVFGGWERKGNVFDFWMDVPFEDVDGVEEIFKLCPTINFTVHEPPG